MMHVSPRLVDYANLFSVLELPINVLLTMRQLSILAFYERFPLSQFAWR